MKKSPKGTLKAGLPDGTVSNQKIPIWVNYGGSCNGKCWPILLPFGLFYGHLVYIVAIFGILFPVAPKNLALVLGFGMYVVCILHMYLVS
jgi:hypothetical protein